MDQDNRVEQAFAPQVHAPERLANDVVDAAEHYACVPLELVHPKLRELIRKHDPQFANAETIALADLEKLHRKWLHELFEHEHKKIEGESTDPEDAKHPDLPDIGADFGYTPTTGERIADHVAKFGGSWRFIFIFAGFLILWMATNLIVYHNHGWDPYPFILLNLCLSCLAAIQAPVIMMSQNRQEQRDHLRSEYDFQINLRAEIALRSLHQKVDRILAHQWERLDEISKRQEELHRNLGSK